MNWILVSVLAGLALIETVLLVAIGHFWISQFKPCANGSCGRCPQCVNQR